MFETAMWLGLLWVIVWIAKGVPANDKRIKQKKEEEEKKKEKKSNW